VHGTTDADAVFGMIYAQAEDDFNRVETNFLVSLGRLAEAEGEGELYRDLRQRLFIDTTDLKAQYASSPAWLKALMDGWADGLNYYLAYPPGGEARVHHPVRAVDGPVLQRGEHRRRHRAGGPRGARGVLWRLRHGRGARRRAAPPRRPARAAAPGVPGGHRIQRLRHRPANTVHGHALLLINPHTSFFFRSERR
jgi:acyl-homoserine-lactone acylase